MTILQIGKQRQKQNRNNEIGFTLIEILLVVVIVAIVVSITAPQFHKTFTAIQLANTTQDIAYLMRYLRSKAASEKSIYQLKFDLGARKYFAQNISGGKISVYEKPRPIPENINITATLNPIKFYPDGSIDEVSIFLFKGKSEYFKDIEKAINKEFELGQIQSITHTDYIYTITTHPSIGRVEVKSPE